jgi:hypothetical protein
MTFNCISRLVSKHKTKYVCLSLKIPSFLQCKKDNLELMTPGVYTMPCECSQPYIGRQAVPSSRIKKHQRHIHLEQPDISAEAVNTASAWATSLSYRTPPSSPPR